MTTLYDLGEGEEGIILKIKGRGRFRQRLMEMGFIAGKRVQVIKKAPLRDPVEYEIMGYHISLRNSEAQLIEIGTESSAGGGSLTNGTLVAEEKNASWIERSRNIQVALIGNPNSGKTTLFNYASGSREKVGNYAGVTVDSKEAVYKQSGYVFSLVDLPGTYSLKSYSAEELYLRNYIFDNKPDIVVNIIDASNLERNLYLTTQLIDMGIQVVIALNMYDELEKRGDVLDYQTLSGLFGIPIVPTVSSRGKGIRELFEKIIEVYENREPVVRHIHINYGTEIESAVCAIQAKIRSDQNSHITNLVSGRFLAIELLESDKGHEHITSGFANQDEINQIALKEYNRLKKFFSESVEEVITDLRYGFISGALRETLSVGGIIKHQKARSIDNYLTDKYLGIPIFIVFMWITFFTTFFAGAFPKHWLEILVKDLSSLVTASLPSGIIRDFITGGLIAGVGGVIVFLPNIVILFLFIALMEDTGYMARAVFIMDKLMHKMGLHGKSFIPLFMGFGCNVPAIMATRIIDSRRDRLITMLITPFMSCSARLPVYILFISAFFPNNQGSVLFILYFLGVLFAILTSLLLKKVFIRSADIPFVMELPPYRMPTLRSISRHVWFRTEMYLKKIGGVILIASVIIWVLSNFPRNTGHNDGFNGLSPASKTTAADPNMQLQSNSFMGIIGHTIEPVMRPLGFDWKLSVSLLSGLAAKEVVVSTLGILYQSGEGAMPNSLVDKLRAQDPGSAGNALTPLVAFTFMLFILTYFPCTGVIAAIRRESATWKWPVFIVVYTTSVAWLLSFVVYQAGKILFSI